MSVDLAWGRTRTVHNPSLERAPKARRSAQTRWATGRATEMKHSIAYHGPYSNWRLLRKGATTYRRRNGSEMPIPKPGRDVDGIQFGHVQDSSTGSFLVVRAMRGNDDVVFDGAVKIEPARHTDGKGFAPPPTTFGDESAKQLLTDALAANPSQAERLKKIARGLGWDL